MARRVSPNEDILLAVLLIAVAGVFYWGTLGLKPGTYEPLGSASAPRAICAGLAILAGIILAGAIRRILSRKKEGSPEKVTEPLSYTRRPGLAIVFIAISIGYVGLMAFGLVGFAGATLIYLLLSGSALTRIDIKRIPTLIVIGVVLGFGCYYLFTQVFVVDLP
jgi:hypothetical protein